MRHYETEEGYQGVIVRVRIEVGRLFQVGMTARCARILGVDCQKVKSGRQVFVRVARLTR
jgi:hypothetical protein